MKRKTGIVLALMVLTMLLALTFSAKRPGIERFFAADREYHYMTLRVMADAPSGGAEHCQMGAFSLFHEVLFDWLENTFPTFL